MYIHTVVSSLLLPCLFLHVFLVSMSTACGPGDCIPSEDEGDKAATKLGCVFPNKQPLIFPDNK